jgi:hypothetical protein
MHRPLRRSGGFTYVNGHWQADWERPLMAGKRPLTGRDLSDFGLFGHFERVVYLDPEVTHCTFKFRMA